MNLTDWWFSHSDYWFAGNAAYDAEITQLFHDYQPKNAFERLLYLDQILRHVARSRRYGYLTGFTSQAVEIADRLLNTIDDYPQEQQVFILMPYRHMATRDYILKARDEVLKLMSRSEHPAYTRFYKATIEKLVNCTADAELIPEQKREFIFANLIDPKTSFDIERRNNEYHSANNKRKRHPIIISLSGGVDSMLCLVLAKKHHSDVYAVHINYNNRETADEEQAFIEWYCESLHVPLFVRRITEITRTRDYLREFYEQITRKIRFRAYHFVKRYIEAQYSATQTTHAAQQTHAIKSIPVVLGHNKTDCEENFMQNIKKWRSLNNLKGMHQITNIDGIEIHRPLLNCSKEEIYESASKYNIPHLCNSTPTWSERGIMRDKVLTAIDPIMRANLMPFSEYVTELHTLADQLIGNIRIEKTEESTTTHYLIDLNGQRMIQSKLFYELLFRRMNISISKKSMLHLLDRLKKDGCRVLLNQHTEFHKLQNRISIRVTKQPNAYDSTANVDASDRSQIEPHADLVRSISVEELD